MLYNGVTYKRFEASPAPRCARGFPPSHIDRRQKSCHRTRALTAKPVEAVKTADAPALLIGQNALKRQCLKTILSRHGVNVEETIPVGVGTFEGFDYEIGEFGKYTGGQTLTLQVDPGAGRIKQKLDHATASEASVPLAQNEKAQVDKPLGVNVKVGDVLIPKPQKSTITTIVSDDVLMAKTTLTVPPQRGQRLTLARVMLPAAWHFTVHITSSGEVLGHISKEEHDDALPDLFWDGTPDCSVKLLRRETLQPSAMPQYEQEMLPRKALFLRLCTIACITRKAMRPWEDFSGETREEGPTMSVSGYVTQQDQIIICSAEPTHGGPPAVLSTTACDVGPVGI